MGKEDVIEVSTKYTKEEYINFNKFHQRKNKTRNIFFIFCIIVIFLSSIGLFILKNYAIGAFYFLISVGFALLYINMPKMFVNRILKSDKYTKDCINNYSFFSDRLEITNEYGNSRLPYSKFFKAYETDTNFYLYINKMQAFMISKSTMTSDNMLKIRKILKNKLKQDFIEK